MLYCEIPLFPRRVVALFANCNLVKTVSDRELLTLGDNSQAPVFIRGVVVILETVGALNEVGLWYFELVLNRRPYFVYATLLVGQIIHTS